jgi:hypothetical protein
MKEYKRVTTKGNGLRGIDGKLVNQRQKPLDVFGEAFNIAVTRLAELEDKIENGTLIELPCKVGDKIFFVEQLVNSGEWVLCNDYSSEDYIVTDIYLNINKEPKFRVKNLYGTLKLSDFGERAFLTKAEAEQKLKELKGEV